KSEVDSLNLRDACEFTPFLIINGEPTEIKGNGGWGVAPRTAIGQRKDGSVVFVVIDGRSITSAGATMKQLQQVLIEEECYNAANLDGGSSTVLYYTEEGGVMNNPSGSDSDGMRFLPNAWLVIDPEGYEPPTDRPPYDGSIEEDE
ncbi:MAG: phosphodiester glycosidase family protein, partial [Clostridia bacterium]|nr:phosphodiester glycosidase family protein [Clostridia bacterium]